MNFFIRIAIIAYALMLAGCSRYDDYIYEVVKMNSSNSDNSGNKPIDALTDSVSKKAFAIKLELTMELRESGKNTDSYESNYANEDRLISLNVYSLTNFDTTHQAGISLNDYFLVSSGGTYTTGSTIQRQVENGTIGEGRGSQGSIQDSWTSNEYLILMSEPQTTGNYSFVVEIGMSDGRHLIDTTAVILY
ncbi:MAG: DUF5034 domain-containing protein [Bacteroidia bacterium]